jgi:hypothetical protein
MVTGSVVFVLAERNTIIAAEPFMAGGSMASLTDRIASMGSKVPGVSADPRSKLSAAAAADPQASTSADSNVCALLSNGCLAFMLVSSV